MFKELEVKFGFVPEATSYLVDKVKVTCLDDFVHLFASSADVQPMVAKMGLGEQEALMVSRIRRAWLALIDALKACPRVRSLEDKAPMSFCKTAPAKTVL